MLWPYLEILGKHKRISRYKHSSLFFLSLGDKEKRFYDIDTRSSSSSMLAVEKKKNGAVTFVRKTFHLMILIIMYLLIFIIFNLLSNGLMTFVLMIYF